MSARQEIVVTDLSNREFLERYAKAGCIGLAGGATIIDLAIRRAERHLDDDAKWSLWSHAFFFQGPRADGHHWVVESDLDIHHKHIRLGVQENRNAKYHDEKLFRNLAVLDFGLTEAQVALLVREALELVANRERYSIREIFGALLGLKHGRLRGRENPLARERSLFCSAFVRQLYARAGVDLAPGLAAKHTTPEDIFRTVLPHTRYVLRRHDSQGKITGLRARLRQKVKAPMARLKARRGKV
jgi:hypothetical protein